MAGVYYEGVGRRKAATARVRLYTEDNQGQIVVNGRPADEYFTRLGDMQAIREPLEAVGL